MLVSILEATAEGLRSSGDLQSPAPKKGYLSVIALTEFADVLEVSPTLLAKLNNVAA